MCDIDTWEGEGGRLTTGPDDAILETQSCPGTQTGKAATLRT